MNFNKGTQVYVRFATGIMAPTVELLTISNYENNLLSFEGRSSYYSVECHQASFYGYSNTMAGNVLVTRHKWQLALANASEKLRVRMPENNFKGMMQPNMEFQLSKA